MCIKHKVGCFSGVKITRFLVRTSRVGINSGLLVANPAANTVCIALSRTHMSLGPISIIGGNIRISFGISSHVHPDSHLCHVIPTRRLGTGQGRWICLGGDSDVLSKLLGEDLSEVFL